MPWLVQKGLDLGQRLQEAVLGWEQGGEGRAGSLAGEVSKASRAAWALQAIGALPRLLPVLPPSTKLCRFYITFIE